MSGTTSTKRSLTPLVLCLSLAAGALLAPRPLAAPIRVLILSGQNNHDWGRTTPELRRILEDDGRFRVEVTEAPESCTESDFARFDVVLSNWNTFGAGALVTEWSDATREGFLAFVRGGGGFVVVHAGGSMFYDWPEFQQLIGATWGGSTGHGEVHPFTVSVSTIDHPITAGLNSFRTCDELWHRMTVTGTPTVLATAYSDPRTGGSGGDEPMAFVNRMGAGRCFNLVLGHDVAAMQYPGFRHLLVRGTAWAAGADPEVIPVPDLENATLDLLFRQVLDAGETSPRTPFLEILRQVHAVAADRSERRAGLTARLSALLRAPETGPRLRQFACHCLSLVGTADQVPLLVSMLEDADAAEPALYALARIPGPESLAGLHQALETASAATLIGILNTLGARGDPLSADAIERFVDSPEPEVAAAAVSALGRVGGERALHALLDPQFPGSGVRASAWGAAVLACADQVAAQGGTRLAQEAYARLADSDVAGGARIPALVRVWQGAGSEAGDALTQALVGEDAEAALRYLALPDAAQEPTLAAIAVLPDLPVTLQARVITVLAERRLQAALPAVVRATESPDSRVRIAAYRAMGRLGTAETVPFLVRAALKTADPEREAVRSSLDTLADPAVPGALLGMLDKADPELAPELIEALARRQVPDLVPRLWTWSRSVDRGTRLRALKALTALAEADDIPQLVQLLSESEPETDEQRLAGLALQAACRRDPDPEAATGLLLDDFAAVPVTVQCALLETAGALATDAALTTAIGAAHHEDQTLRRTAVRTLAAWPTPAPLTALAEIASTTPDPVCRVLAVRGLVSLMSLPPAPEPARVAGLVARCRALDLPVAERVRLLSALTVAPGPETLALAADVVVGDADTREEAGITAMAIAQRLVHSSHRPLVETTATTVIENCLTAATLEQARTVLGLLQEPLNLALRGTASSPDNLDKDGAAGDDQAGIDGDPLTYWDEVDHRPRYRYQVTFPEPTRVSAIRITGWAHHNYAPKTFTILCDAEPVKAVSEAEYSDNRLLVPFTPRTCRVLELDITAAHGPSPAIRELEIFDLSEPQDAEEDHE